MKRNGIELNKENREYEIQKLVEGPNFLDLAKENTNETYLNLNYIIVKVKNNYGITLEMSDVYEIFQMQNPDLPVTVLDEFGHKPEEKIVEGPSTEEETEKAVGGSLTEEELETMQPKMTIYYMEEYGRLTPGDFDNVPGNACAAYISQSFPAVNADGKLNFYHVKYYLYVGKQIPNIDEYLNSSNEAIKIEERLQEFKKYGYTKAVILPCGAPKHSKYECAIDPVGPTDAVFETKEEFNAAIAKINSTYKSFNISLSNAPQEQDRTLSFGKSS